MARTPRDYDPRRASVRTWLYTIARNRIVDARRRASVRPGLAPKPTPESPAEIDRELEQAVLRWQVAAALARLSPEHREVIRLAHYGGLSLREISERKGIPLGTVKSRTSYALRTPAPDPGRDGGARVSACSDPRRPARRLRAGRRSSPAEMDEMERHVAGCAHCGREVRGARRRCPRCSTSIEPADVPPPALSPAVEEAVLDRFAQRARTPAAAAPAPARAWRCAAAVAALGRGLRRGARAGARPGSASDDDSARATRARVLAPLERGLASRRHGLGRRRARRHARAAAARGLPVAGGAIYELWCVRADGRWVSGGTFRAGRTARAEAVLTAAVRPGDYHVMVVTRHTGEGGEHGPALLRGRLRY